MERLQAFKYELMPNGDQQRDMRRFAGSCRFVYNKALALQKEKHEAGGKIINYVALAAQAAHGMAQWRANAVTERRASSPPATCAERFGDGIQKLLRQAGGFPTLQEEGHGRQLPLPRPETDQA